MVHASTVATTANGRGEFAVMPSFKLILAVFAGIGAAIPDVVKSGFTVLGVLIVCDFFTGVMVASKARKVKSKYARTSLSSKLGQYAGITVIGWAASRVTAQEYWWAISVAACIAIEVASNIENVILLERYGGAHLGPARPFLNRIARYFAIEEKKGASVEDSNRLGD